MEIPKRLPRPNVDGYSKRKPQSPLNDGLLLANRNHLTNLSDIERIKLLLDELDKDLEEFANKGINIIYRAVGYEGIMTVYLQQEDLMIVITMPTSVLDDTKTNPKIYANLMIKRISAYGELVHKMQFIKNEELQPVLKYIYIKLIKAYYDNLLLIDKIIDNTLSPTTSVRTGDNILRSLIEDYTGVQKRTKKEIQNTIAKIDKEYIKINRPNSKRPIF